MHNILKAFVPSKNTTAMLKGIAIPSFCQTVHSMERQESLKISGRFYAMDNKEKIEKLKDLKKDLETLKRLQEEDDAAKLKLKKVYRPK